MLPCGGGRCCVPMLPRCCGDAVRCCGADAVARCCAVSPMLWCPRCCASDWAIVFSNFGWARRYAVVDFIDLLQRKQLNLVLSPLIARSFMMERPLPVLLLWNPFWVGGELTVKVATQRPATNNRHTKSTGATKNRHLANWTSGAQRASDATVVHEVTRDLPYDTGHCRTSARESVRSWRIPHSSQVGGKKKWLPHPGGDSPRHRTMCRRVDARGRAGDTAEPVPAGRIYPARSPDIAGSLSAGANAGQLPGTNSYSTG